MQPPLLRIYGTAELIGDNGNVVQEKDKSSSYEQQEPPEYS